MDILLLLCFLLVLVPNTKADNHHVRQHCPKSRCSHDGPLIQFPFRLKGDPPHCGNPEFEVSCSRSNNTNLTMIQLSSSSGLFPIQKIDYKNRYFDVYDGDGCMASRLLNLTIFTSSSLLFYPLAYHWSSENNNSCTENFGQPPYLDSQLSPYCAQSPYSDYAQSPYSDSAQSPYPDSTQYFQEFVLLNCSTTQNVRGWGNNYIPVRCLSVPGHHQVLAVESSISIADLPLPVSTCTTLKNKFYLPLRSVDDDGNDCAPDTVLSLEWKPWVYFPECHNCKGECYMDCRSNRMECYPHPAAYPYDQYDPYYQEQMPEGMLSNHIA